MKRSHLELTCLSRTVYSCHRQARASLYAVHWSTGAFIICALAVRMRVVALSLVLSLSFAMPQTRAALSDIELPVLGDTASGVISLQQEYELGRAWLQAFRSRVETLDDPQLQQYLEQLLYELAVHSELENPRLALVIVNNPTMNAFAVPGGVIGAHTGLFRYAENEDQLASVLAHELAHLSQRHFARSVQNQKASTIGTMAGLLAGIILAATVGGDAGMAAITTTQAAALDSALRYSRQNEQEADRLGMDTLYRAGRDPRAVSEMFEQMMAATRFTGRRPPEFLLTHPLTERRVSDARNRLGQYPTRQYPKEDRYAYMRARAMLHIDQNPQRSINRFESELNGHTLNRNAARYGLALALANAGQHERATQTLKPLLDAQPRDYTLRMAAIELKLAREDYDGALTELAELEPLYRNNYALLRLKAEIQMVAGNYPASETVLETLSDQRPEDPEVWFQLAEVSGLAGDIVGVHQARAEYFILIGVFDKARQQLLYAQKLVSDYRLKAMLTQRLADVEVMMDKAKQL